MKKGEARRAQSLSPESERRLREALTQKTATHEILCQRFGLTQGQLRRFIHPTAKQRPRQEKTHCQHGHEWTPENTYYRTDVFDKREKVCRACTLARMQRFRERQKGKA